jgi:hypothetical protein
MIDVMMILTIFLAVASFLGPTTSRLPMMPKGWSLWPM